MKDALSRIYFDDLPVKLLGDEPRPPLDRIVRAGGKLPGRVDVVVLASPKDETGHVLAPGEIIDRTVEPTKPIYLRSVPKTVDARMRKRAEVQALAEAEAEERQEEDREQESSMQDEQEDMEQSQEDEEMKD